MIMSSDGPACPFLNLMKALLYFSPCSHVLSRSLFLPPFLHPLPPPSLSLSLPLSSVLEGPRTNYQKGHFHLWTAGFNRYLFHAFKINPILQLSVWFVYFVLERSFSGVGVGGVDGGGGVNARDAIHLEPPLYWISPQADQACKKDISLALKQKQ